MSLKILWVTKGLGPGGAEALLAASAHAHDRTEFEIECAYVVPFKDHLVGQLESAGVRCHCMSRHRTDPFWPLRLVQLVRRGNYDIVHVHSPLPGSIARVAVVTSRHPRTRLVTTDHNSWASYATPTRVLNWLTSYLDSAAFAVSAEARDSRHGRLKASVLTHGIDLHLAREHSVERKAMRREFGFSPEHVVIGTVANFRAQKNYLGFLEAVALSVVQNPELRFVAVGQGPLEQEMRARAAALGLHDQLIFTGYRPDAMSVMSSFDIFTLASSWEGLPVAAMEACALGLPIVATAVGGIAETFTAERNAMLVPPGSASALSAAWIQLANSPVKREQLGTAAGILAEQFDVKQAQQTIEQNYRRLTTSNDKPESPHTTTHGSSAGNTAETVPRPARKRGPPQGIEIRSATIGDREDILALLQRSMGQHDDQRFAQLYQWKHHDNAFGSSPAWVATKGESVIAVRVFMRWEFVRDGEILRAVRAVDTATDPDFQGKGLFTALTLHGLRSISEEGVDFVFNTPNDKSRPGYLKMGWREVGRIPATAKPAGLRPLIAMARSRVPASLWSEPLVIGCDIDSWLAARQSPWSDSEVPTRMLSTRRTEGFLRWRYGNPLHGYRVADNGSGDILVVRARRRGRTTELVVADVLVKSREGPLRVPMTLLRAAGCDYAVHFGSGSICNGQFPLPGGGPTLTWRQVGQVGCPPLANWNLTLGDIELF